MRRHLVLPLFLVLAACTASDPSTVTTDSDPADLVIVTEDRIRLVGQDGSEKAVLASSGARQPVVSDDGRSVAWAEDDAVVIWSGSDPVRISTAFAPFYLSWTSSGDALVALGNAPSGAGVEAALVDVDAGLASRLVVDRPVFFDWLADGSAAVFHLGAERLASIDRDGHVDDVGRGAAVFSAPQVVADGRVLVATRVEAPLTASLVEIPEGEVVEVRLLDLDSGESELVFTTDRPVSFAASPDGRVAVLAGRLGHGLLAGELTVIDVDSGEQRRVGPDSVAAYAWSPNGGHLLVFSLDDTHTGLSPSVWDGESLTGYPGFVPTPSMLVSYLPFWDQYLRSYTPWSPDGAAFVYASHGAGVDRVFVQRLDEPEPTEIAEGSFAAWLAGGAR